PTIATVRGPCLAGACELALACDITIASEDAFFGERELKFGAGIVAMILPWVVGPKIAKEIILLGQDRIPAARAREIGMVNRVVASDELEGGRACNCIVRVACAPAHVELQVLAVGLQSLRRVPFSRCP